MTWESSCEDKEGFFVKGKRIMNSKVFINGDYSIDLRELLNEQLIRKLLTDSYNIGFKRGYADRVRFEESIEFQNEMREKYK